MHNYYQYIIPRLNGDDIERDFRSHLALVRKGIAGFIVFGGSLNKVRRCIRQLQEESDLPLVIASDLERGLGQQLKGGTPFPPAMALAKATPLRRSLAKGPGPGDCNKEKLMRLRESFRALAEEARFAGINTVLAPVLDINTNPDNPIIGVRAFGEDRETVSFFSAEMIRVLQENHIAACGKHFPGHGDTAVDSHVSLPAINRSLSSLNRVELEPFRTAVQAGTDMLMLGHLKVPALDPSGLPVSLSKKAVTFVRKTMSFDGILITDAMNMGGLSGHSEEEACFMALRAGVDIVLHPLDTEKVVSYLKLRNVFFHPLRLNTFRKGLFRFPATQRPDFDNNMLLSEDLTRAAITTSLTARQVKELSLIVISDEQRKQAREFTKRLRQTFPELRTAVLYPESPLEIPGLLTGCRDSFVIAAIFSETRAWKGNAGHWISNTVLSLKKTADLFISFGNPYLLKDIPLKRKILTYWNSPSAEKAAASEVLIRLLPDK